MTAHPSYGPLTPEEIQELINAPYGEALDKIREHDPEYGLPAPDGEPIKWRVRLTREARVIEEAYVTVDARTAEEAMEKAEDLADNDFSVSWGYEDSISEEGAEAVDATPARQEHTT